MKFLENLPAMDHLRSEKMSFVQLIMPVESAHRAVSYLGDLGLLQFKDVRTLISSFLLRSIRFDHFKTHLSTSQFPFPPPPFFFHFSFRDVCDLDLWFRFLAWALIDLFPGSESLFSFLKSMCDGSLGRWNLGVWGF